MIELKSKQSGDYLFPNLELSEVDRMPVGKYGRMRQTYLKENRPGLYARLMLSGQLMPHLHEIEQTAQKRLDELMPQLQAQNNVTEQLKTANQMQWVAQMNSLRSIAEETILSELIFA